MNKLLSKLYQTYLIEVNLPLSKDKSVSSGINDK